MKDREKYLQVFKNSFAQEFTYRANFVMWRVRNVFQIFMVFYLWNTAYSGTKKVLFGYTKEKMMAYVFGLIIVRALVFSSKSREVAGEISRGDLNNYLVKPLSYFKYWLSRDIASKVLNILFAMVEMLVLYFILRPPFFFQTNPVYILGFLLTITVSMVIYFLLLFLTSMVSFWAPEAGWGMHFVVTVVVAEVLSGALFPMDILPDFIQKIIMATPFPYLIYFPLQTYLGVVDWLTFIRGFGISLLWAMVLWFMYKFVWSKGLKNYEAYGK